VAWALKYKKPVIPLRAEAGAELPFRLAWRQFLDFSDGSDVGLARLRNYLGSVGSPKWVLQNLRDQLAEAERELPRAGPEQRPRIRQDIDELSRQIGKQERLVADPRAAAQRTEERIAAGMEQQRQPERPEVAPARARFVNQPPVAAPPYFQDRHVESELIGQFLVGDERILTVVGRGGVGKTAMVCRLLKALEGRRHRHRRRHWQRAGTKRGPSHPGPDPATRRGPSRRPAGHQRRPRPRLPGQPSGPFTAVRDRLAPAGPAGGGRPRVPRCHHPGRAAAGAGRWRLPGAGH
jgi:hypothetical protein